MNNDLEQFSEETLIFYRGILAIDFGGNSKIDIPQSSMLALVNIALAAKQEFKINATLRDINLNVSREAYSASLELNNLLKDNRHVHQIMNSVGDSQLWVDCSEDAYKCEIDVGGVGRILFTTPQPAHAEQPIGEIRLSEYRSDGTREASVVCLHDQADWDNFTDGTLLYLSPQPAHTGQDGWKLVPVEPVFEMLSAGGCNEHHAGDECSHHKNRRRIWAAMLAAAPKPESE